MKSLLLRLHALILLAALASQAYSVDEAIAQNDPDGLRYRASIEGVDNRSLRKLLEESAALISLEDTPPPSLAGLERRIQTDLESMATILRSEGYYAAKIDYEIDSSKETTQVTIKIEPEKQFTISSYDIIYLTPFTGPVEDLPKEGDALGIKQGMAGRGETVLSAEQRLLRSLGNLGYPYAEIANRKVVADFADATLSIRVEIDLEKFQTFGPLTVVGLSRTQEGFVRRRIPWREGQTFDARRISEFESTLKETGLFDSIEIKPDLAEASRDGSTSLPIIANIKERPPRSIRIGIEYSTNEGAGGRVSWEHRNLFGRGQQFIAAIRGTQLRQEINLTYRQPEFGRSDQVLLTTAEAVHEDSDAFDETSGSVGAIIERRISERLVLSGGLRGEISRIEDNEDTQTSRLLIVPLVSRWDSSDSLLDPREGARATLRLSPHGGESEGPLLFTKFDAVGSVYHTFENAPRVTLALRGRVGVLFGDNTDDIPANKRFYSGGAGSNRGLEFRAAGPVDDEGDPLGGRSLFEATFEARIKITDDIGVVPFVDVGNVFDAQAPDFSDPLLWGAGLGLRYYTAIGPLRFDVATPLNPRDGIDESVQFYVSLGQAF